MLISCGYSNFCRTKQGDDDLDSIFTTSTSFTVYGECFGEIVLFPTKKIELNFNLLSENKKKV